MQECEKSDLFKAHEMELLRELSDAEVKFVIVGGAAVNLHGYCRSRGDLDLVIDGAHNNIDRLENVCLSWFGFKQRLIQEFKQDGAKIQNKEQGVDLLKEINGVPTEDLLQNRVIVTVGEVSVPVMSLEHLLASKNSIGEGKDLDDIAALNAIMRSSMD